MDKEIITEEKARELYEKYLCNYVLPEYKAPIEYLVKRIKIEKQDLCLSNLRAYMASFAQDRHTELKDKRPLVT